MESTEEILASDLLKQLGPQKKVCFFTDGAPTYKTALKKAGLGQMMHRCAVHSKKQFCVTVPTKRGHSKLAGTMAIDAQWRAMKQFIPFAVHSKLHGALNPRVLKLMWAWLHRFNSACTAAQLFDRLGALCKTQPCKQLPKHMLVQPAA